MLVSYNVMKKFLDFQLIFVILNITTLTQKNENDKNNIFLVYELVENIEIHVI